MALLSLLIGCVFTTGTDSSLRIQPAKNPQSVAVSATLPKNVAIKLPNGRLTQEQGEPLLRFSLVDAKTGKNGPAIFGRYERKNLQLTYRPSFSLLPGKTYRAIFHPEPGKQRTAMYKIPQNLTGPAPEVTSLHPNAKVLPANNLKFYIYFSQPMRGGSDMFDHIYLVDEKGNKIADPWLRDELWDNDNQRLLLFIHPGRIKWGLLLRQLLGPVLFPGRRYSLVVSREVTSRNGKKLKKDYKLNFRTTAEHRTRIELSQWKISAPLAGTRGPLQLSSPLPLDHLSMKRHLEVVNEKGKVVDCRIEMKGNQKHWQLIPKQPWRKSDYSIKIDPQFVDVAGNTPLTPFDRDLKKALPPPQRMEIGFRPFTK